MIVLRANNRTYRFCAVCRAPMRVIYDSGDTFFARCPNSEREKTKGHESVLRYNTAADLQACALAVFQPGIKSTAN